MELLYVWIEDYKNIKKQGFNFSPKHWFDFKYEEDDDGNVIGGKLNHKKRIDYYPTNFFGENISNVTAIVGKNGSGKSNLLEFIMEVILHHHITNEKKFIICFSSEDNKASIYDNYDFKIDSNSYFINQNPINKNLYLNWRYYSASIQNRCTKVSYSYEGITNNIYQKRTANLSIHGQLLELNSNNKEKETTNFQKIYTLYQFKNTDRQIRFLREFREKLILIKNQINLPQDLILHIPIFSKENENIFKKFSKTVSVKDEIRIRLKLKILLKLLIHSPFSLSKEEFRKILSEEKDVIKKIIQKLKKQASESKDGKKMLAKTHTTLQGCDSLCDYMFSLDICSPLTWQRTQNVLSVTTEFKIEIDNFDAIEFYKKIDQTIGIENTDIIELKWEGLSAGEEVLLNQISLLYDTFNELNDDNHIFIAIDEGEVTLHPEWQKEYCNLLIQTINIISKPNQYTHLILSTHSPFLVSDLPKDNIIFLNKKQNGECEVKQPQDRKNTFGANIHDLFKSSFFMENGFIGEFASKKINSLFNYLQKNEDDVQSWTEKTALYMIETIGEPILQRHLYELYEKRFDKNNELVLQMLESQKLNIEKRINLQKRKNDAKNQ